MSAISTEEMNKAIDEAIKWSSTLTYEQEIEEMAKLYAKYNTQKVFPDNPQASAMYVLARKGFELLGIEIVDDEGG